MNCTITSWVEGESAKIDFTDIRLVKRYKNILESMIKKAQSNICSTFNSWSDIKACYRFISNPKVTEENILASHKAQTLQRIKDSEQVLLIQDTPYFDYNKRTKTTNLDVTMRQSQTGKALRGLMLHNTMAVTTEGLPLGIISQDYIERKAFLDRNSKNYCSGKHIEEKESYRWIKNIKAYHAQSSSTQNVVHVADREGDIYELYRDADYLDEKFIIRANINRAINKTNRREEPQDKLFEFVANKAVQGSMEVRVQANGKKKFRQATLSIRYAQVSIPAPANKTINKDGENLPHVAVWAILAKEEKPPASAKAIEWMLITNLPINHKDEAIEKITWYSHRWNIEIFHKILKSGCSVENAQLRDGARLKKYIALKSIVAMRIFWLTRTFNQSGSDNCETVLSKQEWQILYRKINRSEPPKRPPTIKEVYYWIGKLGGHIGRNSDLPPGIISIWRGWTRFMDVIEDYHVFCG